MCKTDGQFTVRIDCILGSVLSFCQFKVVCILQIRGKGWVFRQGFLWSWLPEMGLRCRNALHRRFRGFQGFWCIILNLSNRCVRTSTHTPLYTPFCSFLFLYNLLPHKFRGKCWHVCLEVGLSTLSTAGLGRQEERRERQAGRVGRSRAPETGKSRAVRYRIQDKAFGDGNCCILLCVCMCGGERDHTCWEKTYWC